VDLPDEKEKRKKEIEEKLHGLNDNKHNLVLVLKQVNDTAKPTQVSIHVLNMF